MFEWWIGSSLPPSGSPHDRCPKQLMMRGITEKHRAAASSLRVAGVLFALAATGLACNSEGNDSSSPRRKDRVPVPDVSSLPGGDEVDRASWIETWRTTPGPSKPRCINVDGLTAARSGQFIVGNFAGFIRDWDGTYETSKLYYIPLYPGEMSPLTVVAKTTQGSPQELRLELAGTGWSEQGAPFYVSGTVLPARGHWRLTPRVGRNRGCFEFRL
jgi:hypothetical protein